jgi:hypothetical protein
MAAVALPETAPEIKTPAQVVIPVTPADLLMTNYPFYDREFELV